MTTSPELARAALQDAAQWWADQLERSWVPDYLDRRGLREASTSSGVGWAPEGWTATTTHLAQLGYSDQVLLDAGLAVRASTGRLIDVFRDRMVLPVSHDGGIVGFLGRVNPAEATNQPKWLNSPNTAIYDKSGVLYGLDEATAAIAAGAMPVVVEGPLDVLALRTIAQDVAIAPVAPCGTALTSTQVRSLLKGVGADRPVAVCFDGDTAGRRATLAAWVAITRQAEPWQTPPLLHVAMPPGRDPADLVQAGHAEHLHRSLIRAEPLPSAVADITIAEAGAMDHLGRQLAVLRHFVATDLPFVHRSAVGRYLRRLEKNLDLLETGTVMSEALEKISPSGTSESLAAKLNVAQQHPGEDRSTPSSPRTPPAGRHPRSEPGLER